MQIFRLSFVCVAQQNSKLVLEIVEELNKQGFVADKLDADFEADSDNPKMRLSGTSSYDIYGDKQFLKFKCSPIVIIYVDGTVHACFDFKNEGVALSLGSFNVADLARPKEEMLTFVSRLWNEKVGTDEKMIAFLLGKYKEQLKELNYFKKKVHKIQKTLDE